MHANAIVVDEAFMLSKSAWTVLESRVAGRKGRILATSTPYKTQRWPTEIIDRWKSGDPDYFVVQMASNVNPGFDNDEFERLQKTTVAWRFSQDYLGQFVQPEGLVYPLLGKCGIDPQPLPLGPIYAGIDFGHGGAPSSAIVGVLDSDNVFWVFWEYYAKPDSASGKASYIELAKDLTTWQAEFHRKTGRLVQKWFCDSATDTWRSLKLFRMDGCPSINARPVKKGAGSVEYGIDLVDARIRSGKLKIVKGPVKALLEEAELYRWDMDEDGNSNKVLKGPCHSLDALRYALMSVDRKRSLVA